ncbi:MAG: thiamine diphosphokinase [Chloroflexota bacterium]
MSNSVLFVANGDIPNKKWFKAALSREYSAIVGVDGGTNYLLQFDVIPDVVVGDLDSLDPAAIKILEDNWVNVFRSNPEKDETDLEIALLYYANLPAWKMSSAVILGAQGGRLDHEIANLMLLTHPNLQQRRIEIRDEHQTTFLISERAEIYGRAGDTVSLIPLKGDSLIKNTTNLKWPLIDSLLKFGPARGVSNVMTASSSTVEIESGLVLCIHTESSWDR